MTSENPTLLVVGATGSIRSHVIRKAPKHRFQTRAGSQFGQAREPAALGRDRSGRPDPAMGYSGQVRNSAYPTAIRRSAHFRPLHRGFPDHFGSLSNQPGICLRITSLTRS